MTAEQDKQATGSVRDIRDDITIVWGSVTDSEIVEKTVRDQDVVFHLAARINVDESIKAPRSFLEVNVFGTYNVLEAVRRHECRLIHASTCEVYGESDTNLAAESHSLEPHSPYAASKAGADRLCFAYWRTYQTEVTIVRPCNIFGPGQKSGVGGALIPIFVERGLSNQPLLVFGTGEQRREYMFAHSSALASSIFLPPTNSGHA